MESKFNKNKDDLQKQVIRVWKRHKCVGTALVPTGSGKTRIGVMAMNELSSGQNVKILIVSPRENLRDNEWPTEIKKWGKNLNGVNIIIKTIQGVYLIKNNYFDCVIIDEIHTMLSDEYYKFFLRNKFGSVLGLTAKLDKEIGKIKLDRLNRLAPVIFNMSLDQARKNKIVSDFRIYNLSIDLSGEERELYDKYDALVKKSFSIIPSLNHIYYFAKNPSIWMSYCVSNRIDYDEYSNLPYRAANAINQRKNVLYNSSNKIDKILRIADKFHDRQIIVFTETIEFAKKIHERLISLSHDADIYHSKMKKPVRKLVLDKFNNQQINILVSVKALDLGLNIENVSVAVIASGTSRKLQLTQRMGRAIREQEGKVALIYQLFCRDTVEVSWTEKRVDKSLKVSWH